MGRSILTCVLAASRLLPASAEDVVECPPVKALRALYENDKEFHATMDKTFANIKDPGNGPANPWQGKRFEDLATFFNQWYSLLPLNNDPAHDEFAYITKLAWLYYENDAGLQLFGKEPGLSWSRSFVTARGKFMDSKESAAIVRQWMDDPSIGIDQYIIPPNGFGSFNEFFVRDFKPGARTVASPNDNSVLVAPTDCVLNLIEPLTPGTRIATKLGEKLNVRKLLNGSPYADHFENGSAISCFLLPNTYHHYHAVLSGKVVESREDIAGKYWGIRDFPAFVNRGNIGYGQSYGAFTDFRRGYFVIETEEYGYVAMIPIGLETIGSVVFEDRLKHVTPENPVPVHKGEKMGHFAYGGSLVITLIEQGISSVSIPQGQQIGVFKKKKTPLSK